MTVLRKPSKKPQLWNHMLKSLQCKTPYHGNHVLTRNLSLLLLAEWCRWEVRWQTLAWTTIASSPCSPFAHPWDLAIEASKGQPNAMASQNPQCVQTGHSLSPLQSPYTTHTVHFKTQPASINCKNHWRDWQSARFQIKSSLKSTYFYSRGQSKVGTSLMRSQYILQLKHTLFSPWPNISKSQIQSHKFKTCSQPFLNTNGWPPGRAICWTVLKDDWWSQSVPPSSHTWCLGKWALARTCSGLRAVCGPWSSHDSPVLSKRKPMPNPQCT